MKVLKYLFLVVTTICLAACGDSKLQPVSTKVNGPLGKFFEVVDRNYNIKDGTLSVEFKRIADGGPKSSGFVSYELSFTVDLLDEDGNVICSKLTDRWDTDTSDQLNGVISLATNETATIKFKFKDKTNGAVKFRVTSQWDESQGNEENNSDSLSSSSDESSSETPSGMQPSDIILPSQLKGVVEVLNGENGSIPVEYGIGDIPHVSITFKLLKKTSTSSMENPYGQVFLYGVPQDKSGRMISEVMPHYNEWRNGDSDGNMFKEFLTGEVGSTITFEFSGTSKEYDEKCNNEVGVPKIAKFKLAFDKKS